MDATFLMVSPWITRIGTGQTTDGTTCVWQTQYSKPGTGKSGATATLALVAYTLASKSTGKYIAKIKDGRKRRHIGVFDTFDDASKAYEAEASHVFGDFKPMPDRLRECK